MYLVTRGTDRVTVIVLNEVSREDHNSFWHLFGGIPANIQYGAAHYRRRTQDASTVLNQLFESYQAEGVNMPYTIEDFRRDFTKEHLNLLSPDELIEGLTAQQMRALRQKLALPEMRAVVEQPKQEIERAKAARPTSKQPTRRKQERAQPKRPTSRRKRRET